MDAEFVNAPKTYIIKGKKSPTIDNTPALLKSKLNYGTWNTADIRPLATIPLAIGLYGAINEAK